MKPDKYDNANLKVLATATLIRRFHQRCTISEIYDKAIRCYETLFESIEKAETAEEISALLDIPADTIKIYAEAIINILLFNKENDPYLSFGLNKDASLSEVSRRWKSLIVLYHPDKYFKQSISDEKAKKINEIYEKIQNLNKNKVNYSLFNNAARLSPPIGSDIFQALHLKYIPLLIIWTAIVITIFSILFLIFNKIFTNSSLSSRWGIEMVYQVTWIARNNVMDVITYSDNSSLQTLIKGLFLYAK